MKKLALSAVLLLAGTSFAIAQTAEKRAGTVRASEADVHAQKKAIEAAEAKAAETEAKQASKKPRTAQVQEVQKKQTETEVIEQSKVQTKRKEASLETSED